MVHPRFFRYKVFIISTTQRLILRIQIAKMSKKVSILSIKSTRNKIQNFKFTTFLFNCQTKRSFTKIIFIAANKIFRNFPRQSALSIILFFAHASFNNFLLKTYMFPFDMRESNILKAQVARVYIYNCIPNFFRIFTQFFLWILELTMKLMKITLGTSVT